MPAKGWRIIPAGLRPAEQIKSTQIEDKVFNLRARHGAPSPRSRGPLKWIWKHLGPILITVGGLVVLCAVFTSLYADFRRDRLVSQYESACGGAQDTAETGGAPAASGDETAPQASEDEPEPGDWIENIDGIDVVGVLTIPDINLTVAIGEGTDHSLLKYAVGHFPDTALPGETGNCCVSGHRNYTFGKFFNRLDELEAGDELIVKRGEHTYIYTVTETFVVDPDELWVLDQGADAELTLITCTPVYIATRRLIVRAALTS